MSGKIDFDEERLYHQNPKILELLLKDRTTNKNIRWATDNYINQGFLPQDEMLIQDIIQNNIISPRVSKSSTIQRERTRDKAEVFTPSWLVKCQIDEIWNNYSDELKLQSTWLEIACGEAPYIVSRYDVTTGEYIKCPNRIGFLDRKLQLIHNNNISEEEWFRQTLKFYKQTYGYEFQGDSLLIARENLLKSFIEYYEYKFEESPSISQLLKIAEIISFNIVQADGLTRKVPFSEVAIIPRMVPLSLFDDYEEEKEAVDVTFKNWENQKEIKMKDLGETSMKFDVVIGNPPYQLNDNGQREDGRQNASATAIYPYFIEEAEKISNIQSMITPARYLYGAGKGIKSLHKKMLNDDCIQSLTIFNDARLVFGKAVSFKGGAAYFIRNNSYHGKAMITTIDDQRNTETAIRYLDENHIGVFIQSKYLSSILNKVQKKSDKSFSILVSSGKPYGLRTFFLTNPEKNGKPNELYDEPQSDGLAIYGLINNKRAIKYVSKSYPIDVNEKQIKKFKVHVPKASGSGKFGEVITNPFITKPNEIVTETFINIGPFNDEITSNNVLSYIKTKFFRALLSIKKTTQDISKGKFEYIPLQDFTENSDIDWNQSISEIDKQLYKKYNLSKDEIEFIEENVKEMD